MAKKAGEKPKKAGVKAKEAGVVQASVSAVKPKKLLNGGVDPSIGKATQFKPGQSGNPEGKKPGTISLSKHIQNLLNDDDFEQWVPDAREGWKEYKGAPIKAVIKAQIVRAIAGDGKAFDLLAKYGYGVKIDPTDDEGNVRRVALV